MKERLKEQLGLARIEAYDFNLVKERIIRTGCFSPVSVETLEKIVGAYDELIKALVKALGEIEEKTWEK